MFSLLFVVVVVVVCCSLLVVVVVVVCCVVLFVASRPRPLFNILLIVVFAVDVRGLLFVFVVFVFVMCLFVRFLILEFHSTFVYHPEMLFAFVGACCYCYVLLVLLLSW